MSQYQTGKNIQVVLAPATKGVLPARGLTTARGIRFNPSPGLRLTKAEVVNQEVRRDGQTSRNRHGTRSVPPGTYAMNLMAGDAEPLLEAVSRGTWTPDSQTTVEVTVTASQIVRAAGSWLADGWRRGMMLQVTASPVTANNGRWVRVVGVTATQITYAATPVLANQTVAANATLRRASHLINGNPPVERYFVAEEANLDIDESFLFRDVKISQVQIETQPDNLVIGTFTLLGLDAESRVAAESPYFTAPTYSVSLPLSVADSVIRINDEDVADLAGFTFTWDLGGSVPSVLGPTAPDVFLNNGRLTGSFTAMRKDGSFFRAFSNEDRVELFLVFVDEPGTGFLSIYVGNAVYGTPDGGIGGDGALNESVPWSAGADDAGGDRAATTFLISSSIDLT
jgi:hypothetical protein